MKHWDPGLDVDKTRPIGPLADPKEEAQWCTVERKVDTHPVLGLFGFGSGPILLLDKSTFQSLSYDEHAVLHKHFTQNVVPILVWEILGDLAKEHDTGGGREADEVMRRLCAKFGGGGTPLHQDWGNQETRDTSRISD